MADSDGAMMGWTARVPRLNEGANAWREAIPTIGIPDLEDLTCDALSFSNEEGKAGILILDDRKKRHGSVFYSHFDGESIANFSVIDLQGANADPVLCDPGMSGPVVAHQQKVFLEVEGIKLGERPAGAEFIQNLHCKNVLDFIFACDGDAAAGQ